MDNALTATVAPPDLSLLGLPSYDAPVHSYGSSMAFTAYGSAPYGASVPAQLRDRRHSHIRYCGFLSCDTVHSDALKSQQLCQSVVLLQHLGTTNSGKGAICITTISRLVPFLLVVVMANIPLQDSETQSGKCKLPTEVLAHNRLEPAKLQEC